MHPVRELFDANGLVDVLLYKDIDCSEHLLRTPRVVRRRADATAISAHQVQGEHMGEGLRKDEIPVVEMAKPN